MENEKAYSHFYLFLITENKQHDIIGHLNFKNCGTKYCADITALYYVSNSKLSLLLSR